MVKLIFVSLLFLISTSAVSKDIESKEQRIYDPAKHNKEGFAFKYDLAWKAKYQNTQSIHQLNVSWDYVPSLKHAKTKTGAVAFRPYGKHQLTHVTNIPKTVQQTIQPVCLTVDVGVQLDLEGTSKKGGGNLLHTFSALNGRGEFTNDPAYYYDNNQLFYPANFWDFGKGKVYSHSSYKTEDDLTFRLGFDSITDKLITSQSALDVHYDLIAFKKWYYGKNFNNTPSLLRNRIKKLMASYFGQVTGNASSIKSLMAKLDSKTEGLQTSDQIRVLAGQLRNIISKLEEKIKKGEIPHDKEFFIESAIADAKKALRKLGNIESIIKDHQAALNRIESEKRDLYRLKENNCGHVVRQIAQPVKIQLDESFIKTSLMSTDITGQVSGLKEGTKITATLRGEKDIDGNPIVFKGKIDKKGSFRIPVHLHTLPTYDAYFEVGVDGEKKEVINIYYKPRRCIPFCLG